VELARAAREQQIRQKHAHDQVAYVCCMCIIDYVCLLLPMHAYFCLRMFILPVYAYFCIHVYVYYRLCMLIIAYACLYWDCLCMFILGLPMHVYIGIASPHPYVPPRERVT
jgi:hypothetical protein